MVVDDGCSPTGVVVSRPSGFSSGCLAARGSLSVWTQPVLV